MNLSVRCANSYVGEIKELDINGIKHLDEGERLLISKIIDVYNKQEKERFKFNFRSSKYFVKTEDGMITFKKGFRALSKIEPPPSSNFFLKIFKGFQNLFGRISSASLMKKIEEIKLNHTILEKYGAL